MSSLVLTGEIAPKRRPPVAAMVPSQDFAVLGSVITLDARQSADLDGRDLSYNFYFVSVPIGSRVALEAFRELDEQGGVVSFSPDVVGQYVVGLRVSNGVFDSELVTKTIDVRAIMVPHARGLVPDGKFIWSYLRDVWTEVDGKEFFETLWSALIQLGGSELMKLYQVDYNKSIRDIQDLFQRRWLCYEPRLELIEDDLTFFLGNHSSGTSASTGALGETGLAIITSRNELLVVQGAVRPDMAGRAIEITYSRNAENVGSYAIAGLTSKQNGFRLTTDVPWNPENTSPGATSDVILKNVHFSFTFQSTTWNTGVGRKQDFFLSQYLDEPVFRDTDAVGMGQVRVGDIISIPIGRNAGLYRVIQKVGGYVIVDHKPPGASDPAELATIYRPVGFVVPPAVSDLSDTLAIPLSDTDGLSDLKPGRVIVVGGETHTIARVAADESQRVPSLVIATSEKRVLPGQKGLHWRIPHTLVSSSQNFEKLGVRAGDTLLVHLSIDGGTSMEVPLQVVGATGNRLGFVLSLEPQPEGGIGELDSEMLVSLADRLGIEAVRLAPDRTALFSEQAKEIVSYLTSIFFRRAYWNVELGTDTVFSVAGHSFRATPKAVIRNRLIPVDKGVRSIPALQEYVSQPVLAVEDGQLYQVRGDKRFPRERMPVVAQERLHYVVDGETAYSGPLTFRTGSDLIDADGGDFVDSGVVAGDVFHIESPISLYGDYPIAEVISRRELKLSKPIPRYPLSEYVAGSVEVQRNVEGHFIRFIPGLFSPKNPAPKRLWAEVTFFDNSDNIESNFGIMVGLSKNDLEAATSSASYRQAVAGLMYAYVSGSAIDKVRLGASILLGLPFTEKRGLIRSIETDYRLSAEGTPVLGRILVEDIDSADTPLGVFRVYTYPIDESSALAGIDTNPATGKAYVVGDTVEAFASLSKGVEIADFKIPFTGARSAEQMLQQYHSARIRINDNIFQPKEIALVSSFLRRITPSYVALTITNTSEYKDPVTIIDKTRMLVRKGPGAGPTIADSVGLLAPYALSYDMRTHRGFYFLLYDDGPYWIRRAGLDLIATDGSQTLTVESGGLINAKEHEDFESPICKHGDILFLASGVNQGVYTVDVVNDNSITVEDPPFSFAPETKVHYAIARKMQALLRSGTISSVSGDRLAATVEGGLREDGVATGDWFLASTGLVATRHLVTSVSKNSGSWNQVNLVPALPNSVTSYRIYRPQFLLGPTSETFSLTSTGTSRVTVDPWLSALADANDEIQVQENDQLRLTILDPRARDGKMYVTPPPAAGTYQVKFVLYQVDRTTPITFDQLHIEDAVDLTLFYGNGADASVSGTTVTFTNLSDPGTSGILPGDLLTLDNGDYRIVQVSTTNVTLSDAPGNGISTWRIRRRLRWPEVVLPTLPSSLLSPPVITSPTDGSTYIVVVLQSIEIFPSDPTIPSDGTQQFTAIGHYSDGSSADITEDVTWTSSDEDVAIIDNFGFAQAVGGGGGPLPT